MDDEDNNTEYKQDRNNYEDEEYSDDEDHVINLHIDEAVHNIPER